MSTSSSLSSQKLQLVLVIFLSGPVPGLRISLCLVADVVTEDGEDSQIFDGILVA